MAKIKNFLFSDQGMILVDALFAITLLLCGRFGSIAAAVWLAYLIYAIKHTPSKLVKAILLVIALLPTAALAANLYGFLN